MGFQSAHMITKNFKWSDVKAFLTKKKKVIQQFVDIIRKKKTKLEAITVQMTYARPQDKPRFVFRSHASLF